MKLKIISIIICGLLLLSCGSDDKVPAYNPSADAELAPVKIPPIEQTTLDNGLKLIAIVHNELPVVAFRMMVKTGAAADPAGYAGLASFTAELLTKGTKTRSASQIAEEIDFIGGELRASAGWDRSMVSCQVLARHFQTGLDLFADISRNPVFNNSEIERLRRQKISSYIHSKDDPADLANEAFADLLFKGHPYGYPDEGNEKTIEAVKKADIEKLYRTYFVPNNAVIVVSGNIEPRAAFKALKEKFGDWEKGELRKTILPEIEAPSGYKIRLVDKQDANQAQIRMGHFGLPRSHPDYFPVSLMNYVLGGGGFSSRLMKTVRSEMGLTYSIRSRFSFRKEAGPFSVSTFTKSESVGEAIAEIIDQVKEFQAEGALAEELEDAKSYLTGSYPLRFETPGQIAGQLLNVELHDLGEGYIENYRNRVQAVTLEQVKLAAVDYLNPDNMVIVVVGKQEEIIDQLKQLGEVDLVTKY